MIDAYQSSQILQRKDNGENPFQHTEDFSIARANRRNAVQHDDHGTHHNRGNQCKIKTFSSGGFSFKNNNEEFLAPAARSEEHTSELQSLMRISYTDFCL